MAIQVSNSDVTVMSKTQTSKPQAERQAYLNGLLATAQAAVPADLPFTTLRKQAAAIAQEHGFPDTRQEDWRFTNLAPMLSVSFQPSTVTPEVDAETLAAIALPEVTHRLVFVNGQFSASLSQLDALPEGLIVGNLAHLYSGTFTSKFDDCLGQSAGNHDVFASLNTVGFQDAAILWVPSNQVIAAPIQLVFLSIAGDGAATLSQPRCLVVAESGSAITLVEDFYGSDSKAHFTNSVTEIWVEDNAQVNHVRLQREGSGTFHIGKTAVTQGCDSRYTCTPITTGAQLSRHNLEVTQTGPQTETTLQGLSAIAGTQLADTHSIIAFNHPHGTANQRHKCIVDDRAHAVFNGKMWVPRNAQQTNASQLNRNLLLSDKGRIDTKPELDIVADNVKCAHGATISQLDADEVFYLQSRGISGEQAQQLLIYGFAMEIIDAIPLPSLRETLTQVITAWTR
ncbi:MAG: Fe-S cluster assembly protein SufD [Cyanobacteria bacterium]|nr:Fe-S cluster assembly protein SufD [Cyanobacteriota bacterium]MDA0865493.1 Fe-S cluster assembly protein SufD [Cyanobacteriota bacterium]